MLSLLREKECEGEKAEEKGGERKNVVRAESEQTRRSLLERAQARVKISNRAERQTLGKCVSLACFRAPKAPANRAQIIYKSREGRCMVFANPIHARLFETGHEVRAGERPAKTNYHVCVPKKGGCNFDRKSTPLNARSTRFSSAYATSTSLARARSSRGDRI